jgi:hypothetical protein
MTAILLSAALLVRFAPAKRAVSDERLLGPWVEVGWYLDGVRHKPNPEKGGDTYFIVKDDRFVHDLNAGTVRFGAAGELDFVVTAGEDKGWTVKCRYAVKDDQLWLAHPRGWRAGAARPAAVASEQEDGAVVSAFTRHGKLTEEKLAARMKFLTEWAEGFSSRDPSADK